MGKIINFEDAKRNLKHNNVYDKDETIKQLTQQNTELLQRQFRQDMITNAVLNLVYDLAKNIDTTNCVYNAIITPQMCYEYDSRLDNQKTTVVRIPINELVAKQIVDVANSSIQDLLKE